MASIEKSLENGMLTLVGAVTYISTNSIPVVGWKDIDEDQYKSCVIIHIMPAAPAVPEIPQCGAWRCDINIIIRTLIKEDSDRTVLDSIYDGVFDLINGLQADSRNLLIASNLAIDAVRFDTKGGDDINAENFQHIIVKCNVYLQQ